ncbi:HTATSF1 [Cordylochernes scorpioides]|uniref:HTATSF1 n=1 Tax=Cordylochernes scorpioides TaxID=51811 RepID=A0ABY6LGY9_9ARAC|nr:HTATSF1 [Cordylochernes scorpioides]
MPLPLETQEDQAVVLNERILILNGSNRFMLESISGSITQKLQNYVTLFLIFTCSCLEHVKPWTLENHETKSYAFNIITINKNKCRNNNIRSFKKYIYIFQFVILIKGMEDDFAHQLEQENLQQEQKVQQESRTYTDKDGVTYEWDHDKNAWFPKLDEDFLATYKLTYGGSAPKDDDDEEEEEEPAKEQPQGTKRKAANDPAWFDVDEAHNTKVYVTNLPLDITEEEFVELMSKCGMLMKDPDTNQFKVKLYRDKEGQLKGDALCCYIKIESVDLALKILDGYVHRNHTIGVEPAKFQLKGEYNPSLKPKKKKKKDKEKLKKKVEKLFAWQPDKLRGERPWHEKTAVLKNMFDPKDFDGDAGLLLDYQADLRDECSKCGEVKKVVVYDRNPEGVATITFKEHEHADACIKLMNNRWFAQRKLSAELWDGKTKFKVEETEEERQKRLKKWDSYLEQKEDKPIV